MCSLLGREGLSARSQEMEGDSDDLPVTQAVAVPPLLPQVRGLVVSWFRTIGQQVHPPAPRTAESGPHDEGHDAVETLSAYVPRAARRGHKGAKNRSSRSKAA